MRIASKNIWGSASTQGLDQQRDDLWFVDFKVVADSLNFTLPNSWLYVKSLKLPDLDISAEAFKRDSRPYYLPGYDKPMDAVSMTFFYPIPQTGQVYPPIYHLLYKWRARVRAGRGAMSGEATEYISEANNYGASLPSRWDLPCRFLRGNRPQETSTSFTDSAFGTSLSTAYSHILKNAWLSNLGISELDTTGTAKGVEIRASFYCEDVLLSTPDGVVYVN
jgi:hypothetical protein